MKKTHVFLIALFGAVLGCVATQATRTQYADAQYQPGAFRECGFILIDGTRSADRIAENATAIPPGWTPLSGIGDAGGSSFAARSSCA